MYLERRGQERKHRDAQALGYEIVQGPAQSNQAVLHGGNEVAEVRPLNTLAWFAGRVEHLTEYLEVTKAEDQFAIGKTGHNSREGRYAEAGSEAKRGVWFGDIGRSSRPASRVSKEDWSLACM
jgi:hypothetical protein